jgi:hypothetical protein
MRRRSMETKINGCNIGTYSRTAKKCRKCMNKDYCSSKRIEAEAYIIPSATNLAAVSEDMLEAAERLHKATKNFGISVEEAMKADAGRIYRCFGKG